VLSALPGKAPMSQDYFISFNCVRFMALGAWSLELEAFFFFFLFGQALARLDMMKLTVP